MLHLILGRAGSGKTMALYEAIRRRAALSDPSGALLIVPEQYSHAAERELVEQLGDSASLYAEVRSFTRLAARVREELGGSAAVILDEGGRVLTMATALKAVAGALKLYGVLGKKPEFLTGLLATVDELKQCCLTPENLLDAAQWATGSLRDKLNDLAYIAGAYDAVSRRTDPRDTLTRLADTIPESSVVHNSIFVDGFSDFTAQEGRILQRLLHAGTDLTVALTCDGLEDDSELFRPAVITAGHLRRWAVESGHEVSITVLEPGRNRPGALAAVERYLFADTLPELPRPWDVVELYTAATPVEECELAAARIRTLVMDEGYRYRDIAVAARGFADYETAAEYIFTRTGVPVHTARKVDILEKPILLLLTAALDILDGGWRYEAVFRYLRTGLAGISQQEVDRLELYVRKWNIYGTMWTRRGDWKENPDGYGVDFTEDQGVELKELNTLRRRVAAPLMALEQAGRTVKTATGQATALYEFLEAIYLPRTLAQKADRFRETGRETLAAEYGQIWDILVLALEQVHAILGETPMDQREFSALLRLTLRQYKVGAIPQTLDRVQMGDLDRTRRRGLKCLIVLGATDDRLPAPGISGGVLTEEERGQLREIGLSLTDTAEESLWREMALIYHAFTAPSERLIVSWPRAGEDGNMTRKSPVVARIEAILDKEATPVSEIDPRLWITSEAAAFDLALRARADSADEIAAQARAYFAKDPRFQTVLRQAGIDAGKLSQETTRRLYGERLNLSASRIDTFGSCKFRYFMQYGLKAKPRRRAELDAPVVGTFLHYVLEHTTKEIVAAGGFAALESIQLRQLVERHIADYVRLYFGGLEEKSQRFQYLFRRLSREVHQVAADMAEELRCSDFIPLDFELTFGKEGDLPPVEVTGDGIDLILSGAVDRVDGWIRRDALYLRVVDYKTGRKQFSLSDIWYGLGMQMLLYLFALARHGGEHYGNRAIVPAGALYAPARDQTVAAPKNSSIQEIEKLRRRDLTRSGLILRDPALIEAMEHGEGIRFLPVKFAKDGAPEGDSLVTVQELMCLERHVEGALLTWGREMGRGDVAPLPHSGSVALPCDYCDYRMACHHDPERDGIRYLPALTPKEVWEKLGEKEAEHG
ncbi:MAG: PD-(D/E)XK nuclease family protein [Oscillospiraceae bacterium]|nr:PD-(D/E)XK nuclease family protein [Oscillospiraceae bacterium]